MRRIPCSDLRPGILTGGDKRLWLGDRPYSGKLYVDTPRRLVSNSPVNKVPTGDFFFFLHRPTRMKAFYESVGNFPNESPWNCRDANRSTDKLLFNGRQ